MIKRTFLYLSAGIFAALMIGVFVYPHDADAKNHIPDIRKMVSLNDTASALDLFVDVNKMGTIKRLPSISTIAYSGETAPHSDTSAVMSWKRGDVSQAYSKRYRRQI